MRLNLESVIELTNAKAARIEERCNYVVTGYVLTHHSLGKKAVVDMAAVRWFPNVDEFMHMMTGRNFTPGPGIHPPEWDVDEMLAATPIPAPPAPTRPVLTAPPSTRLLESTEEALGVLAHELGCVYDVSIPHNAGWFVPGKPTACASAYDAIRGLVSSLEAGGTIYRPAATKEESPAQPVPVVAPKQTATAIEIAQGALF